MNYFRLILVALIALPWMLFAGDEPVTPEQLQTVHALFLKAKERNFDRPSVIALYSSPNAASTVKKLIDAFESNPQQAISPQDSIALASTRQEMNLTMLRILSKITGGSVEVMDAGKQNGARSDKDQMIFGVTDGKRAYTATEMKGLAERVFISEFGIPMEKLDMTMFDADAAIPDWRRADISFEEYVMRYEAGQAKLEQNPGAVREAGTWRKGAELRYATQSRVTLVKHVDPDRKLPAPDVPGMRVETVERGGEPETFHVIENMPTAEASERYRNWSADVPYRNAMDAAHEWAQRYDHSADFIDRMKYFNRTVGDGINALALENWGVEYIFHLNKLATPAERQEFIRKMVNDVYVVDLPAEGRELFTRIIAMSAEIELDKMNKRTRSEAEYMQPLLGLVRKEAEAKGERLSDEQATRRALGKFYEHQQRIMKHNLVATARQKIRGDFTQKRLDLVVAKYGPEQAKKLQWETGRQIQRIFSQLDDDALIRRIISDVPAELQPNLRAMHEVAKSRRATPAEARVKLAKSDPDEARRTGPQEQEALAKVESDLARKKSATEQLLAAMRQQWTDFNADLRAGEYSDEAITARMKERALDALGFEERAVFNKLQVEYETQFRGSKLLGNLVNWGNAQSLLSVIQVYQQTGDMTAVAQTALWELVSNVPGVSQAATLKQSWNDGDAQSLSWLFIAWKIPAAGHAKMVFDVAKGSVEVLYTHAMTPLKEDRFSQVYMGYVEKQPAGWSPFVPGWKERRDAVGHSILHFVPGETFEQKRSNLYVFFHERLDKKLRAAGFDPTKDAYWKERETVLPAFFRKYVHDYFNAQGDWSENVTAGLYWVGEQEELKTRLAGQLQRDFERGELNHRLAEAAKDDMAKAIARIDDAARENIQLERRVAAAEDFVAQKVGEVFARAIDRAQALKGELRRVKVEVYPSAVVEGQQAVFAVKVASAKSGDKTKYPVEIRPAGAKAVATNQTGICVTTLDYDVVVKKPTGEILASERVSVNLTGTDAPQKDAAGGAVVKMLVEKRVTKAGGTGMFAGMSVVESGWEDPNAENAHPFAYPRSKPHLWIRWPNLPAGKNFAVTGKITGGIPKFEKDIYHRLHGYEDFLHKPAQKPGNAFRFAVPMEGGYGGQFVIEGKLLAFPTSLHDSKFRETKPDTEFPFRVTLTYSDPPRKATGTLQLYPAGDGQCNLKIEGCQRGARLATIKIGGTTVYEMFRGDNLSMRLPHADEAATTATVSFRDFGKDVTVTADLQVKPATQRFKADERNVPNDLNYIAKLQKENEEANLDNIASIYARLASYYSGVSLSGKDFENWTAYTGKHLDYLQRAAQAMRNPDWKGYSMSTTKTYQGKSISSLRGTPQAAAGAAYMSANYYKSLADTCASAVNRALRAGNLELAHQFLKTGEQAIEPTAGQKDYHRMTLQALHTAAGSLARETLRLTGDFAAAQKIWQTAQSLRARLAGVEGRTHTVEPFPIVPDPEF